MKWIKSNISLLLLLLYLLTFAYAFYISRYASLYGLGAIMVIFIQAIALIALIIGFFANSQNLGAGLKAGGTTAIVLQSAFIVFFEIEEYKPTRTITIPDHVVGCVHLFVEPGPRVDVMVDDNGIGYVGSVGEVNYEIEHRGHDITDAFHSGGWQEILLFNPDSTSMIAYNVSCLDITGEADYPTSVDPPYMTCLDTAEFRQLVNSGIVSEARLRKQVWRGSGNGGDWTFDEAASNRE